jgi:hypothetical protein
MLNERIEAIRRFVQEQKRGIVLHCDDQSDLLARSVRQEFYPSVERRMIQTKCLNEALTQESAV